MSGTNLMSVGARAMSAAQVQLQTTGHNITNASVDGYSRQQVNLATADTQYSGAGYFGRGVDVTSVTRVVNGYLTDQVAQTGATAAMDKKRADLLGQMESVFRTGTTGLGSSISQVFSAWSDVATNPADLSARQVALQRADDLASHFRNASNQLDQLQGQITQEVQTSAASVSALAEQVALLNKQIAGAASAGQPPNDMLDQRDRVIDQISQLVQVTRVEQGGTAVDHLPEGSKPVNLFIGGGLALVVGGSAATLSAVSDPTDPTKVQLQVGLNGQSTPLVASSLGGGALAGLLSVQDDDLKALRQRLDGLASGVAAGLNQQQALGTDQDGQPGQPLYVDSVGLTSNVTAGNIGLSSALKDQPRRLAAAGNPVTVQPHSLKQGDLTITSVSGSASPPITARTNLVFTDASGSYEWRNAAGATLASGTWSAGAPISYAGLSFSVSGQPQAGEGFSVTPGAENGNALLMAQLGDATLADGTWIKDGYARLISDVGTRSQGAQTAATVSAGVNDQAKSQLTSQTGVNLDEEAAKLIQYQQSYQAAAKVLQVAQRIFDTLLSATGG
ncbi:MAG: hypothetical protein RIQ60_644 [Pseudomonadota bacterium]|jgi:flagellar hook-associated protein 1 FlgK